MELEDLSLVLDQLILLSALAVIPLSAFVGTVQDGCIKIPLRGHKRHSQATFNDHGSAVCSRDGRQGFMPRRGTAVMVTQPGQHPNAKWWVAYGVLMTKKAPA